ncbi:hypothetical protein [Pedobacter boryungensis]|uniref:Uncharacterized protein n=1 Tax=Pedobacter boryungensis TaxID=869962 RepID=A0ABX2DIM5_9SPHI|nr:hypothetical protein [Pedobacter boryungensis]NQX32974.1 hypothetical protein [Pedobacter boryungensis]
MGKQLLFSTLLIFFISTKSIAQTVNKDAIEKTADKDVRNLFKLEKSKLHTFRKYRYTSSSDFFKPSELNVSDPSLLTDSVYVNAYRTAAYYKTKSRRTAAHYVVLGAGTIVVASTVVIFALLAKTTK